jgi:nucleoside-diphosphate-sugar epimerase
MTVDAPARGGERPARVLVAGASGMVGSAVLAALDRRLAATVRLRATHRRDGPPEAKHGRHVEWVRADFTRPEDCALAADACDWAVICAADTGGVRTGLTRPWAAAQATLVMLANVLGALRAAGAGRVVVVGSATVYQSCGSAVRESDLDWSADPAPPHFGMGWTMRSVEKLCELLRLVDRADTRVVRAANVYGPRAPFSAQRANFIPALIRKACDHMDPFEVWGTGDVVRDVVYADDLAEGVARLLDTTEFDGGAVNLGSGRGVRVAEVVDSVLRACGHTPKEVRFTGDSSATPTRLLDCSRARAVLDWAPSTSLDAGIRRTAGWWAAHKDTWTR